MTAWRLSCLAGCAAGLITACAVQPLTPGPGAFLATAEIAAAPELRAALPAAPVVQVATFTFVPPPDATSTPLLPTPIPYLTPTPILPTTAPALEGPAAVVQPTLAPTVQAAQPPVAVVTEAPPAVEPSPTLADVAPIPTATSAVAAAPPSGDAAAAEVYMVDLINQQRIAAGVAPLLADPLLMSVARGRVDDMVARGYTGHDDPVTGEAMGPKMIHAAGFTSTFVGENWYGTIKPPPSNVETAMSWFMTDPPHARNILSPYYAYVGVGLAFNGRQWLIVQNFAGLN